MEKRIYLVLTQTGTILSRMIKVYTRADYNHVSIALTPDLKPMYSFGRRQAYNPYWGGFVREYQNAGIYKRFPRTRTAILSLPVTEEIYEGIANVLNEMYESKEEFGYDFIGLCLSAVKIKKRRDKKYYCSDFIKSIFQKFQVPGSETLRRFTRPSDFLTFPGATPVYRGYLRNYRA